jgi:hypothetical protein
VRRRRALAGLERDPGRTRRAASGDESEREQGEKGSGGHRARVKMQGARHGGRAWEIC